MGKSWSPRMSNFFAHLKVGGMGLDPNVRDAIETLKTLRA
ncbi:hypothetical protein [Bradyrhizobium lablabi]